MLLTVYDNVANTHEIGCEHSVRRRGRFIVPVSLRNQNRVFSYPNTCIHIIKYVYSFHHTHISVRHFVGVFIYAGAINRSPTAANGLPKCANGLPIVQYLCVIMWCLWGHKNRRSAEHFRISTLLHNAFYKKILGKLCHNLACGVPQES